MLVFRYSRTILSLRMTAILRGKCIRVSFPVVNECAFFSSAEQPMRHVHLDGCSEQRPRAVQTVSRRDGTVYRHMPPQCGSWGRQHASGGAFRLCFLPASDAVPGRLVLCNGRGVQILAVVTTCRCPVARVRDWRHTAIPQRHARNRPLLLLSGKKEPHLIYFETRSSW